MDKRRAQDSPSKGVMSLVLICFFLSGLTGLTYEILWTRMIVEIIGSVPFAVSIILTVFMGGLGLGSYIASRTVDRIRRPRKLVGVYGVLELVIGAYGLVLPALLTVSKPLYAILYNQLYSQSVLYNLITFVGCAILLCIPAVCMGATLPILCRFYVTRLSHLGTHAGRLYGFNTIGAALGALLCGFWLIGFLGVTGTLIFAIVINGIIGLACLTAGFTVKPALPNADVVAAEALPSKLEDEDAQERLRPSSSVTKAALLIFGVSGFCAMAYEVIWTKLLGLIVGPTTYSFTIVLVTFILGLALGSMVFGWLGDKTRKPIWLLLFTQIAAALFALGASQLLGNSQLFFAKLIFNFQQHFALLNMMKAAILLAFMILPTLCLGATFPLVGKIYTQSVSSVGRSIGFAYMINTIGAVLGSFCAGFILIPTIGKENGLSLTIGLQLCVSVIIVCIIIDKKIWSILKWLLVTIPALTGIVLCFHLPKWNRHTLSMGKYYRFGEIESQLKTYNWLYSLLHGPEILSRTERGEVVYYGDGIGGFTTVVKYPGALGNLHYSLAISGKADASSRGDMKTQTLLAHFPMLFHRGAGTVMVLGLASGVTAGEVLHYPVEQLDVIDINRQVTTASDFFIPWNNNVLYNPKTNLIIQDGRAHLQSSKQKYDVIISEPSNPWMAGLSSLFTRDFFKLAKDRLNDEGIFVQFMHSHRMDWSTFSMVGRSFAQVFPNSILVLTEPFGIGTDYLLIGFRGKDRLVLGNAKRNLVHAQKSKNITLLDPKLLYRLIVSEELGSLFGEGPVNTDARPRLEFAAPRLMYTSDPAIRENMRSKSYLSPETRDIIQEVTTDADAQINFAAYAFSVNAPFYNMVELPKATTPQKERFSKIAEQYCITNTIEWSILNDEKIVSKCIMLQIGILQENIDNMPDKALSYFYLGDLYATKGMWDDAISSYRNSLKIKPNNAEVNYNLAVALNKRGRVKEVVKHFNEALRIRPDLALKVHKALATVMLANGQLEKAVKEYQKILAITPDDPFLYNDLGVTLAQQGKSQEAIEHFRKAVQIKPDFTVARKNLEHALGQKERLEETK